MHLQDKVALVTGGSRGLGFLLARELGTRGAKVAICARDSLDLEDARADLARRGIDALAIPCDVGDRAAVERMVEEAVDHYGRIDVLVNNAGVIRAGPLESQRIEDFERLMRTMFWGPLHTTLASLPHLKRSPEARIANITSIGGKIAAPHMLPYNTAKFAALGFSEGLRAELADTRIRVTTVVPGFMRTGSHLAARFKGDAQAEANIFSTLANAPLISMDAERAARKIADAIEKGEAETVLGAAARLAMWTNGIAPGLTSRVVGLAARTLPDDTRTQGAGVQGQELVPPNEPAREHQR